MDKVFVNKNHRKHLLKEDKKAVELNLRLMPLP